MTSSRTTVQGPPESNHPLRSIRACLRRDWAIERTYRLALITGFLNTIGFAVGVYFVGELITDPGEMGELRGGYFDFVIIGLAVNIFLSVGLSGLSSGLMREQATGTLDLLVSAPTRPLTLITGMLAFPLVLASVDVAFLLLLGLGIFGSGIEVGGLLLALPVLALTVATFVAVGIAAAGLLLVAKRGDPITAPFLQLSLLLSGAFFPVGVLPGWLQATSKALPATWGIETTRDLMLGDAGFANALPSILVLCGFVTVMIPAALFVFDRCLRSARRHGLLGSY